MPGPAVRILLEGVVGSRAYGLAHEGSDTDRLGVWEAPPERLLSLRGLQADDETLVSKDARGDRTLHEAAKYLKLCARSNPSAIELLYLPSQELVSSTDAGMRLREVGRRLVSAPLVQQAYGGFAGAQLRRLDRYDPDDPRYLKMVRHLFRLLAQGVELLEDGGLGVRLHPARAAWTLDRGGSDPGAVLAAARPLLELLDQPAWIGNSALPDAPDTAAADEFLLDLRLRRAWWATG